jgi:hypothetical protein
MVTHQICHPWAPACPFILSLHWSLPWPLFLPNCVSPPTWDTSCGPICLADACLSSCTLLSEPPRPHFPSPVPFCFGHLLPPSTCVTTLVGWLLLEDIGSRDGLPGQCWCCHQLLWDHRQVLAPVNLVSPSVSRDAFGCDDGRGAG